MATTKTKQQGIPNDPQGFWAQDENFGKRLDEEFPIGTIFLVHSVRPDTPFIHPDTGESIDSRTALVCQHIGVDFEPMGIPTEYKTLSGPIHSRAKETREGDFPCLVKLRQVDIKKWSNQATIMDKVADWPLTADFRKQAGLPMFTQPSLYAGAANAFSDALEDASDD